MKAVYLMNELGINSNIDRNIINKIIRYNEKLHNINIDSIDLDSLCNINFIKYTILHIKAIEKLEEKLNVKEYNITKYHDLDKIALYIILSKNEVHNIHKSLQRHHSKYNIDKRTIIEKCLDWESGHMTKVDKPLSAYEFLINYKMEQYNEIIDTMTKLGMANNTGYKAISDKEYKYLCSELTNTEILKYITRGINYIDSICNQLRR